MAKQPFDVVRAAMLLLAVLIISPALLMLLIALRCVVFFVPECVDVSRLATFRDWLAETIPVLVAIIMGARHPPPPPPPHSDE